MSSDEEPEGEPEQVYVDFAALEGVNSDIVAWLYGADTGLNYPIVQAEDNDYYLYRLLDGTWNTPCGSSAEQHWKPSFAYIDRCNCYHPDGKEEKPAHPCAGGF